jgi:hypothetical protein
LLPVVCPPGFFEVSFTLPDSVQRLTWLSGFLADLLGPHDSCLLWVTTWGVWPSSENWHLYYRLRQSYSDHRLIHEAPGHYFLGYEKPDLISFLELSILSGWDVHLLPSPRWFSSFISHDEYVRVYTDETNFVALKNSLEEAKIDYKNEKTET